MSKLEPQNRGWPLWHTVYVELLTASSSGSCCCCCCCCEACLLFLASFSSCWSRLANSCRPLSNSLHVYYTYVHISASPLYCKCHIHMHLSTMSCILYTKPWECCIHNISHSRKIWRRFGGWCYNRHIKIHQNFLLACICMAILYRIAKLKSANILAIAILGSTNSRQYFRLYRN